MLSLNQIEANCRLFEQKSGINLLEAQQGSIAWLDSKLGVLSASNASKIVAKIDSETRKTYMLELVAQVATGIQEELNAKALDWGRMHEDAARSTYEFQTDSVVKEMSFIFKDDSFRCGVSVDGLAVVGEKLVPVELKVPYNTVNYLKFSLEESVKSEWQWQCQFGMWCLGAEKYHMAQYDPRMRVMPFKMLEVERDEKKQATLSDAVPQFISDMDKYLKQLGIEFGCQWQKKG